MCKKTSLHAASSKGERLQREHDQKIREETIRAMTSHQPRLSRIDRATDRARTVLAWCGGTCAAYAVSAGVAGRVLHVALHVIVIATIAVLAALGAAAGIWGGRAIARQIRDVNRGVTTSREELARLARNVHAPLPQLEAGYRTTVTGVSVRAIGEADAPAARTLHKR